MLVQEPVQAAIWDALNNYAYGDAVFLAERLYAEISSSDTLHLLATCYYRSGKAFQAYMLLEKSCCQTPQCKYLMAKCCTDFRKYQDAESLIAGTILSRIKSYEEIESEFGSMACHVFSLLGFIYSKTERLEKASTCYKRSLKLNPLLWKSYEQLCMLGENVKAESVFQIPNQTNFVTPCESSVITTTTSTSINSSHVVEPVNASNLLSPRNVCPNQTPENTGQELIHRGNVAPVMSRVRQQTTPDPGQMRRLPQKLFNSSVHISPSFGLLPVENPSPVNTSSTPSFISPVPSDTSLTEVQAPIKTRPMKIRRAQTGKAPPVLAWSKTYKDTKEQETAIAPTRRSSRLFGNSNSNSSSVKENNKSQTTTTYNSSKLTSRRVKTRTTKTQQELNQINKAELSVDTKCTEIPLADQIVQMKQQSLSGILSLLANIGKAYQLLSKYKCAEAIEVFSELAEHQYRTGWVLCQVASAYDQLSMYNQACKVYEEVRRKEPYRMEGLDLYSNVLWHSKKEVELSTLAHEVTAMDCEAPEALFVSGNCFSLVKEHDMAIKFLQRAIQVDPNYVYAYILLALEYQYLEELDKAITCFRNAIRLDSQNYKAWYGVGMIYYKQEKFNLAELHHKKALSINPHCPILLCNIGVAQFAQNKNEMALNTLSKAIKLDPKNVICIYHRACMLFSSEKHEQALAELEKLKDIVPKESMVYFLMGKVHKKLGNTHLAMMNFSWATSLDPKGLNNQIKEAVDVRNVMEEEDPIRLVQEGEEAENQNVSMQEEGAGNVNQEEGPRNLGVELVEAPDLQAIESDESL